MVVNIVIMGSRTTIRACTICAYGFVRRGIITTIIMIIVMLEFPKCSEAATEKPIPRILV